MGEFVSSKFIIVAGVSVLAVCMWISISLAHAFTSLEEKADSPLFPRSMQHSTAYFA